MRKVDTHLIAMLATMCQLTDNNSEIGKEHSIAGPRWD